MANVEIKHVYKYYPGAKNPSVSDFNLNINNEEFIVFVGPSGCGKSTTLRMVAGLEEISQGEIYIDGVLVNELEPKDRDIAMVFQNYALYPQKTVYDNMAFALKLLKVNVPVVDKEGNPILDKNGKPKMKKRHYTRAEIDEKVIQAADILQIRDYLERKPKELSGGQRQRVAIGRAIVRSPKVFLMDEPLSNLDAKLRNQMRSEIILLRKRIKTTFIYVTHDQIEAMTLGDRIVVMKDGFIQQVGTPMEVFANPANLFVAGFIGTPQMNFIETKLATKKDGFHVSLFDKDVKLPSLLNERLKQNDVDGKEREVVVGIRPEHFLFTNKEKGEKAKILINEMMGTEYHIHVDVNGTKLTLKAFINNLEKDTLKKIVLSEDISIEPDLQNLYVFDKETGVNLTFKKE